MVNKYNLKKYLTSFFILNKDLLLKSGRLTTIKLKVTTIGIKQVKKSLAFTLQIYL